MGNSEVGHMNIGAGRIVDMDLRKIERSIENKEFSTLPWNHEICKRNQNSKR
jgi:2,3-bisphosphoglycerate-independent phosphoglycerate mutase